MAAPLSEPFRGSPYEMIQGGGGGHLPRSTGKFKQTKILSYGDFSEYPRSFGPATAKKRGVYFRTYDIFHKFVLCLQWNAGRESVYSRRTNLVNSHDNEDRHRYSHVIIQSMAWAVAYFVIGAYQSLFFKNKLAVPRFLFISVFSAGRGEILNF